jgi:hypothetical protein
MPVHRSGRFVKNEQFRFLVKCPRQGDQLLLATRQSDAFFSNDREITVWELIEIGFETKVFAKFNYPI